MPELAKVAADLRRQGFDGAHVGTDDDGMKSVTIKCSQCQASVINGVACHEHGCPNTRR